MTATPTAAMTATPTAAVKMRLRLALRDRIAEALWEENERRVKATSPAHTMREWLDATEIDREYWLRQATVAVRQLSDEAVIRAEASS